MTPLLVLASWLRSRDVRWVVLIGVINVASALAVSYYAHLMRRAFAEQQVVQAQSDELLDEKGRLILERSAFTALSLVETVATDELNMRVPDAADTHLVLQP